MSFVEYIQELIPDPTVQSVVLGVLVIVTVSAILRLFAFGLYNK